MTLDELRTDYTHIVKVARRELARRQRYRGWSAAERKQNIGEMEKVLEIAEKWKDLLKAQCEAEVQQADMFEDRSTT